MTDTPDWISSDFHYNHVNMVGWRGIESLEVMNDMIRADWMSKVGENDTILILGDVIMGSRTEGLAFFAGLPGRKLLMPGNHDYSWSGMGEKHRNKWTDAYSEVFELVPETIRNLFGLGMNACHFPYSGDHTDEERYVSHRPPDDGKVLLHGHVHSLWATNGRQINVGWDVRDGIWSWDGCMQEVERVRQEMRDGLLDRVNNLALGGHHG